MPLHYRAWVAALGEYAVEFPEALFYQLGGMPTRKIIELLNERHGHDIPPAEATELKERLFEQLIPEALPVEPVVRYVHEYSGRLPMAVATGGYRPVCVKTLEVLGLLGHFQAVVTAEDVKHGKPAPDVFLEAARRIGIAPEACAAFEDAELGLQSARAAGMHVIDIRNMRAGRDS
jgi:HAD superfamily hydrolase (TIGR01509 family)